MVCELPQRFLLLKVLQYEIDYTLSAYDLVVNVASMSSTNTIVSDVFLIVCIVCFIAEQHICNNVCSMDILRTGQNTDNEWSDLKDNMT